MASSQDKRALVCVALGRIFKIASRPFQEGNIEEYERCRAIILGSISAELPDYRPNYARDRQRGAAGD